MAFPVIAASNSSAQTTNSTSHTVSLPTGIASGDMLLAGVVCDARPALSGALVDDWTFLTADSPGNDLVRLFLYFRRATGGEGSTVAFTTATSQCTAHRTYRITGSHESTNPYAGGNNSADSVTSLNPPAVDPSTWVTEDTLWIAFACNDDGTTTITGFPTSYINTGQISADGATDGVNIGWATRENAVSSEDPSAFTFSAAKACVVAVVALRPTSVAPPITPTVIAATATLYQPLVQNMTLQPSVITASAVFIGHEPVIVSMVMPAAITATATAQQPTVVNLGTTQNINPAVINASATVYAQVGVFLVGPISPTVISAPATLFQPFVGTNIVPTTITVTTTLHQPTMNLEFQYLNPDRIVVGMFVFSPTVIGSGGGAGLKATVRDIPKNASVSDPTFKATVSATAKTAIFQESDTVTLRD